MNPVAEQLTGWTIARARRRPLNEVFTIVNEYTRKAVENPTTKVLREGVVVGLANHTVLISRDGAEYFIDDSGAPIRNAHGDITGVVLVFRDATDKRKAEQELKNSERYFRSLLHNMHEDIIVIDGDYRITDVNNEFLVTLGKRRDQIIGRRCHEVLDGYSEPCEAHGVDCGFKRVFETGESQQCRHMHIYKDGSKRHMDILFSPLKDESGKTVRVIEAIRDISPIIKAQEALHESEERLKSFSNVTYEAIVFHKDGILLDVNKAFTKMFGYERNEVVGKPAYDQFIPPECQDLVKKNIARDYPTPYEIMARKKDGTVFHLEVQGRNAEYKGEIVRVTAARDITERKRAEEAIRESESELAAIYQNAPFIMMLVDGERRIRKVNGFATEFAERSKSEMLGMRGGEALRCLHSLDDVAGCGFGPNCETCAVRRSVIDTIETGKSHHQIQASLPFTIKGRNEDLTFLLSTTRLEIKGKPMVLVTILDITARKQAEEESRRLAEAVRQSSDGIVITDTNGRIIFANPAFEQITGFRLDEVIGETPRILKSGKQDTAYYKNLWDTVLSGKRWAGRMVNQKKDGTLYTAACSISPVKDQQGRIVHFVWITRDITEMIQMEERLNQAQKMEAIGTLAGGIAHDFNNILFPLLGFTEMLKDDLPEDSPLQEYVNEILHASIRARNLVQQILDFSRKSDQERIPLKLQAIIKEAVQLLRASIPKTIEIKQNIDPECGRVMADPTQVHQIVMNLATNAYHAMEDEGGVLTLTLKQMVVEPESSMNFVLAPGKYACLSISDTGTGMPKAVSDRVFEPYFTTKESGKGTGLGLSVVHGIVKSYGGDIRIYSEPGKGTECHIYLPLTGNGAEWKSTKTAAPPVQGGNEKILLVDDEEPIVRMEKQMLERLGYDVTIRTSSVEALEAFKADPYRFDLVITDMTMPNMTGIQLAGAAKKINPNIPVIICTGFSEQINDETCRYLGIEGYVMKPIARRDIAETIRRVLDGLNQR